MTKASQAKKHQPAKPAKAKGAANGKSKAHKPSTGSGVDRSGVRVRMYRQGLGDCFLLTFPKPDGADFFVLIDCGVILGTPNADALMKAVIEDIAATTTHIDILVATHEHWDHVSGFDPSKNWFKPISFGEVWLAWTEDPENATANRLRRERAQKLAALWLGVVQMQARLGAEQGEARETLERAAQVLSFFGIDPGEVPPPGGFAAAAAAAGGKTGAAMRWVRECTPQPKFHQPGDLIDLPQAGGVRAYVLGPPTDQIQLFKDLPTRSGRETYDEDAPAHPAAAARSFFAAAFPVDDPQGLRPDFDAALPFDRKYQIDPNQAEAADFFRDHYLGSGPDDPEAWRRIQGEWMAGAADFALQLDSDTNNTSLALAFELPDGRVLLFPGDAQVGNWESWHADSNGHKRTWKVGGKEVTAESLLNRTVLYKVGHHGSHNATLREKGLEMMTDPDLIAMVPVDVYIAHEKKKWLRMPFNPLLSRIKEKTQGRILQSDDVLSPAATGKSGKAATTKISANSSSIAHVTNSSKLIEVTGPGGKPTERPLFVEYALPLEKGS